MWQFSPTGTIRTQGPCGIAYTYTSPSSGAWITRFAVAAGYGTENASPSTPTCALLSAEVGEAVYRELGCCRVVQANSACRNPFQTRTTAPTAASKSVTRPRLSDAATKSPLGSELSLSTLRLMSLNSTRAVTTSVDSCTFSASVFLSAVAGPLLPEAASALPPYQLYIDITDLDSKFTAESRTDAAARSLSETDSRPPRLKTARLESDPPVHTLTSALGVLLSALGDRAFPVFDLVDPDELLISSGGAGGSRSSKSNTEVL